MKTSSRTRTRTSLPAMSSLRCSWAVILWTVMSALVIFQPDRLSASETGSCRCQKDYEQRSNETGCGCTSSCVYEGTCCMDYRDNGTISLKNAKCKYLSETPGGAGDGSHCETDECVTRVTTQILFCSRAVSLRIRKVRVTGDTFEVKVRDPQNDTAVPILFYITETGCVVKECFMQVVFNVTVGSELVASRRVGHNRSHSCSFDAGSCFWPLVHYNHQVFDVRWAPGEDSEDTIQHKGDGFVLRPSDFSISDDIGHEGQVATCLGKVNSFAPIARYLQPIFGGISLISISVVVWLHWKFPKLHNLYGFCLLSLVGALAVTNVVPLLQEVMPSGLLTPFKHYAWLAVFAWESVIILHVYRSLGGTNVVHSIGGSRNLSLRNSAVQYALFSWGVPIPFVLTGVVCHLLEVKSFQYGVHWFDDHTIATYIFFIPSFCCVVVGLALFIATLTNMDRIRRQSEESGGAPVDILSIALRLQLTLGVPWIGFIILKFFADPALLPVVLTINSLQGFFIMLAFTTTKRVKRLVKDNYSTYPTAMTAVTT